MARYYFDSSALVKLYHNEPGTSVVEPIALQAGWEYVRPVSNNCDFYFSQDLQSRAEVGWNIDAATQTGFGFHARNGKERIRFFLEYFHGHSPEGQFSAEVEEWASIGSSLFL